MIMEYELPAYKLQLQKFIEINRDFGEHEARSLLIESGLCYCTRNNLANELINLINCYIEKGCYKPLIDYIQAFPIIDYFYVFTEKLKLLISDDFLSISSLKDLGKTLLYQASSREEIKLFLTLCAFAPMENISYLKSYLSNYDEFTFYLIYLSKNNHGSNSYTFNLAKRLNSYGRLIALYYLEFFNDEMKLWAIEEGWKASVYEVLSSRFILDKVSLSWYISHYNIDSSKMNNLSILIQNYIFDGIIDDDKYKRNIESYLNLIDIYGNSLQELTTLMKLKDLLTYKQDLSRENLESFENTITRLLFLSRWSTIINEAIKSEEGNISYLLKVSKLFGIVLSFEDLLPYLKKDKLSLDIYSYVMNEISTDSKRKLVDFAMTSFNLNELFPSAFSPPPVGCQEEYPSADYCFEAIIKDLKELVPETMKLNLLALTARYRPIRKHAIINLSKNINLLRSGERFMIEDLIEKEQDPKIRRELHNLIYNKEKKRKQYIDIRGEIVRPYMKDVLLSTLEIDGVCYRDPLPMVDVVYPGAIIYLKEEKDSFYDNNAILVTAKDGYVLGYIPKQDTPILKSLITGGKYLYGIIKEASLHKNLIKINVFLSYEDVLKETKSMVRLLHCKNTGIRN